MSQSSDNGKGNMHLDSDTQGSVAAPEMTLAEVRKQLEGKKGKRYWQSIDELAGTPEFEAAVAKEFPDAAQEWVDPVSRRGFLKLMSASLALAGLAGCTKQPDEPIYPYVKQPEDLVLGKSNYFATAHPFATGGVPLLVKADAFRPIKVDGNPVSSPRVRCSICTIRTDRSMRCCAAQRPTTSSSWRPIASV
jgi:molybdopterin-containing oxidoreductase family iron-sulfur binding subunit